MEIHWAGKPSAVAEARLWTWLGAPGLLEVKLRDEAGGAFRPRPGDVAEWHFPRDQRCAPLRVAGLARGWWRFEPEWVQAPAQSPALLTLCQRPESEATTDFLSRVMAEHGQEWAAPTGEDAPLSPDPLETAWPVDGVCQIPPHAAAGQTAAALLAVLAEGVPSLRGVALGLQRPTDTAGPWRLRFDLPDSTDENHNRDVGGDWALSPDALAGPGCWVTCAGPDLNDERLASLLDTLLSPSTRAVDFEGMAFPRLPTTVRLGPDQPPRFCGATRVRLWSPSEKADVPWKFDVSLRLDGARPPSAAAPRRSRVLLAECSTVPEKDGEKLYGLVPPPLPPEPALRPAAQWRLQPPGETLLAARLSPGFARPGAVALYSRLRPGDLVWIRVADGELPLILGALHQRCDRWESGEQACDVAIGAPEIELGEGGEGPRLRLAGGAALLAAPDELTLSAKASQVSERLNVKGPLEAADVATFKGDVKVG